MNRIFPLFIEAGGPGGRALTAILLREFRAALMNRYFQVFSALSLLSGIMAIVFSENADAIGFFIVQVALFLVSLFALLAGVSSAQAEREEWQLMFSQPIPRAAYVIGKFRWRANTRDCDSLPTDAAARRGISGAWPGRRIFGARPRAGAHHRRDRMALPAFRYRSYRTFCGAARVYAKDSRFLGFNADVESARCISNSRAIRAPANPSRSSKQNSARKLVDRACRDVVQRNRSALVRIADRAGRISFKQIGGVTRYAA
jgi:hypothetical protein